MANREEEDTRCIVPRPSYVRELEPGLSREAFHSMEVPALADPKVLAHNRELVDRALRNPARKKAG